LIGNLAFGRTKVETRLGHRDRLQACSGNGRREIDMKFPGKNRREDSHQSKSDTFPEARLVPFTADEARPNDG